MDNKTISRDGTPIAYEVVGHGPAVILVSGAMSTGASTVPVASLLANRFTVVAYDRRGRGASGDTAPYAVAREVEDLAALVEAVGGEASLWGMSSGGALVLEAAASGLPVRQVAVYEAPFADFRGGSGEERAAYTRQLNQVLAEGRPGDAVALFLALTGMPEEAIAGMRRSPGWPGMEAVAPSLAHDDAVLGDGLVPRERVAAIGVPVLAVAGGASEAWIKDATRVVAETAPRGTYRTLDGQTHRVDPEVLAPVLAEFFGG
ncbi:alpha/beta hydrolase [Streptomyces sp. NPDC005423]|uniref:alpha/beta fold hydrolase n=1 Tax=Streptomyces sp. NPDC005423 TaxID=3155343 RepID=UPI0033A9D88A